MSCYVSAYSPNNYGDILLRQPVPLLCLNRSLNADADADADSPSNAPLLLIMRSSTRFLLIIISIIQAVQHKAHRRGHQHHHLHQLAGCSARTGADFSYLGEGVGGVCT